MLRGNCWRNSPTRMSDIARHEYRHVMDVSIFCYARRIRQGFTIYFASWLYRVVFFFFFFFTHMYVVFKFRLYDRDISVLLLLISVQGTCTRKRSRYARLKNIPAGRSFRVLYAERGRVIERGSRNFPARFVHPRELQTSFFPFLSRSLLAFFLFLR